MDPPVRGSSRHGPQVVLAPLPQRTNTQGTMGAGADYDLHESDYGSSQNNMASPQSASSSTGWSMPGWSSSTPGRQNSIPQQYNNNNNNNTLNNNNNNNSNYYQPPPGQSGPTEDDGVKIPVEFDLAKLSLSDSPGDEHDGPKVTHSSEAEAYLNSDSTLRYSDSEPKKPVERTGYADDTRYSGQDQTGPRSSLDHHHSPDNQALSPPIANSNITGTTPQRVKSIDSTHSSNSGHSAVRAYALPNDPTAATYVEQPELGQPQPRVPHPGYDEYGSQAGGPSNQVYGGQDYGYGAGDYQQQQGHVPPPPHHRGGPPHQQYGAHDPRYQQQHQYGGNGGYGQAQYDQYGQPYSPEYGQDYYQDQQGYGYQQQGYGGAGYDNYGGGYPQQGPGYRPPQQQYYGGGGRGGPPPGANLHPQPSMRGPGGPGFGRGGPRPGPPGDFQGRGPPQPRPPAGGPGGAPGAGGARKRPLTVEVLDSMRQVARSSNDPAAQLEYAKALIEAAVTFGNDDPDPKRQKKNKEALFMEGLKIIKRLATTGMGIGKPAYPDAQFFLANCYGNGSLGLQIDHDKAFNLYTQASKQNHAAATYRTAVCYELGAGTKRDHSRAVQFYRKAASLGDTAAMYKLGMVVLKGLLGQQTNAREAITWLKRAAANADEENPHALHELGLCFEKSGIPSVIPDESYSRELFTQAAGFGYAPSQFKLGHCYEYGTLTCPVDPRRSIAWYTRAAEQGDAESELGLSGWYLTGSEGVLKQSDTEAYLWARKAADKGLARAEYAVGYYSEVGIGIKQDLEEARRWYLRSAAQGNGRAKKRLTEMKKLGAMRRVRPERGRNGGQGPEDENCKVM